jgi:RNA polymerase sigma-70 factor (ECF subfamily)
MSSMAGEPNLSELASAIGFHGEEAAIVAELKAGSEEAFAWLIAQFTQPVYSLVYRTLDDPSDAADTTQEVFIKIFRGIGGFNADSSLKTWIYRIALHEASNQRRWWFRHRGRETSIEPVVDAHSEYDSLPLRDFLADDAKSPLDCAQDAELRERVEIELRVIAEPYRTTLILRDIEELSYEEIAEVTGVSLGTVKSRLVRGREALRKRLERHLASLGVQVGKGYRKPRHSRKMVDGQEAEAMS